MSLQSNDRRNFVIRCRRAAEAAGYALSEGSYYGGSDDRAGRWYIHHQSDTFVRKWGAGYQTRGDAWVAAADMAAEHYYDDLDLAA